jgi:diamine N-acetyltransferase
MTQILIRKATIEDAEYISLLARITFTETFGQYYRDYQDLLDYYDNTFSVSKIRSSLMKTNNIFWIAFCDELPVGYAKLKKYSKCDFVDSNSVSQLQKIYVLKDFLSKKIGHQLQASLFEETKNINSKYLWLSVLKSNERAINFYRKNGFIEIGEHTFDIGKEHFVYSAMSKEFY